MSLKAPQATVGPSRLDIAPAPVESVSQLSAGASLKKISLKHILLGAACLAGIVVLLSYIVNQATESSTNANVLLNAADTDILTIEEEDVEYETAAHQLPHHADPYFTTLKELRKS
jgi:hypothetical protein